MFHSYDSGQLRWHAAFDATMWSVPKSPHRHPIYSVWRPVTGADKTLWGM